ncbi:MAG: hypothetical protein ISS73_05390, partial [Pirellulales bacterium]|nr:hypothetical protein [Pirellulales bacterium]
MNSTLLTRGSLLARLHEEPNNAEAWGEFVRIYGTHVIGWCLAQGLQDADACDVSQEVLVRFWKQAAKFRYDPSQRFRAYLRRIVVSALADRTRRVHDEKPVPDFFERPKEVSREELSERRCSVFFLPAVHREVLESPPC